MKKILVLGGYGNVGSVVSADLVKSGFFVGIAGRNEGKIESMIKLLNSKNLNKEIIDLNDSVSLLKIFKKYDLIVNCLEYTLNQLVLDLCIKSGKNYVDMGDDYEGIKISRSKDGLAKEVGLSACLGAGSAPGIVNVLTKYVAADLEKIDTVTISFADEIKNAPEKMLPFNFQTVVEEITGNALLFENGKYVFVKGTGKKIDADFCGKDKYNSCHFPGSYVTNHDEQFSLPDYLRDKGIKNFYFVMKHSKNIVKLVQSLDKFGFLSKEKINIKGVEISPFEFCNTIMSQYAPQNFYIEDKESLFIKIDDLVIEIVNYSENGIPAGIMNTGIGASLIAQYLANNDKLTPGVYHPEDFVEPEWFIKELKKRKFEIYIGGNKI